MTTLPGQSGGLAKGDISSHFPLADALRATAIMVVVLSHILVYIDPKLASENVGPVLGSWGVDTFFVLSGFLVGGPYVDTLLGKRQMPKTSVYALRRFLRLYPPYAVMVLAGSLIVDFHNGTHHPITIGDTLAHLTLTHGFFSRYVQDGINNPLWTMAVDAQFYVALPILTWIMLPLSSKKVGRMVVLCLCISTATLSIGWRLLVISLMHLRLGDPAIFIWYRGLIGFSFCFAFGGILAYLRSLAVSISELSSRLLVGAGLLLLICMFILGADFMANDYATLMLDLTGALSVSLVIFGLSQMKSSLIDQLLGSKMVRLIADNSYAVYLVHYPIIVITYSLLTGLHFTVESLRFRLAILASFFILVPLLAINLHRFVERPFLSKKERLRESPSL